MSLTAEDRRRARAAPQFRVLRLAHAVITPLWFALFATGLVTFVIFRNGSFMEHPLTMVAFGIMAACLGSLVMWQPRTYIEYQRLTFPRAFANVGDSTTSKLRRARDVTFVFSSGVLFFAIGLYLLVGGISRL